MFGKLDMNITSVFLYASLSLGPTEVPAPDLSALTPYESPAPLQLEARQLQAWDASEARQGVAADVYHFYPVSNYAIGKYRRDSGKRVGGWVGQPNGPVSHLTSCFQDRSRLWCANSSYPDAPAASSIEVFSAGSMRHVDSHSLGVMAAGSLTWFDQLEEGWIAGFVRYNSKNGKAKKSVAFSGVYTFDRSWRRTGGWRLPPGLVKRMAPHDASGGALSADGLLYLFGHDKPELYVLAKPKMGPTLMHIATIKLDAEGQAFQFDPVRERVIWAISRPAGQVRTFSLPDIPLDTSTAGRFFDPDKFED